MNSSIDWKSFALTLLKLVGIYAAILVICTLLTPFFWGFLHTHGDQFSFERIFDRLRYLGLLCFLPLLWPMAGLKGLPSLGWGQWKASAYVALAAAVSVVIVGIVLGSMTGGFQDVTLGKFFTALFRGILVAAAVALIEEIIFRGVLQRILTGSGGLWLGVVLASIIFAWLHGRPEAQLIRLKFEVPQAWELAQKYVTTWPVTLTSGLFINLTLLGVALGLIYARFGTLLMAVGLHFGIVAAAIPMALFLKHVDGSATLYLASQPQTTALLLLWVLAAALWPVKKNTQG